MPEHVFRSALVGKEEISAGRVIEWLHIAASKFNNWRERYGKANEHNGSKGAEFSTSCLPTNWTEQGKRYAR